MSFVLLIIAIYYAGDVQDRWDAIDYLDPARDNEVAAWLAAACLVAAFVAWCVEQIRDAIKEGR